MLTLKQFKQILEQAATVDLPDIKDIEELVLRLYLDDLAAYKELAHRHRRYYKPWLTLTTRYLFEDLNTAKSESLFYEKIKITTCFHFDSAHFLPFYEGPCARLHGHRWLVEVETEHTVGSSGRVIDFKVLKRPAKLFDHRILNAFIPNPTAENLALYLSEAYASLGLKTTVKVYESPESFAEYSPFA